MKRFFRIVLRTVLILFILLNIVTAFHGYKFTHFYEAGSGATKAHAQKTGLDITGDILFGINAEKQLNKNPAVPFEKVILTTHDGIKLDGWYIKTDSLSKGTVILFHGHGSRKEMVFNESAAFRQMGYNTLLIDFRAHGNSSGNTCTIGYLESEDVKLAYDFIHEKGEQRIVLWGISMGAAAITKAMSDYPLQPMKVILEMPYASLLQAAEGRLKLMKLPPEPLAAMVTFWGGALHGMWAFNMKPAAFAENIHVPVLLQWGQNDPRVQEKETTQLFNNLAGQKQLVIYAHSGHQSLCDNEHAKWMTSVENFLNY